MSLSAYQYVSNGGTTYQVLVPADFAAALGMTAAVGSEPYLDPAIAPRAANFSSSIGGRQAVIGTTAIFSALGLTLTVGGVLYTVQTRQSEAIPAYQLLTGPYIVPIQSAPGANGTNGTDGVGIPLATEYGAFTADLTLTTAGTTYTVSSVSVSTGKYLLTAQITFIGAAQLSAALFLGSATSGGFSATQTESSAGAYGTLTLTGVYTASSSTTIYLKCVSNVNGTVVKKLDLNSLGFATSLCAVTVG